MEGILYGSSMNRTCIKAQICRLLSEHDEVRPPLVWLLNQFHQELHMRVISVLAKMCSKGILWTHSNQGAWEARLEFHDPQDGYATYTWDYHQWRSFLKENFEKFRTKQH